MASTLPVVINRSGGTAAAMGVDLGYLVTRAFARAGRTIALELVDGCDVAFAIARHARAPLVAVGGGDGTLGAAAAALAHTSTALAVLPLGTRNHLARQLGVPPDLDAAAALAVSGRRRRIDLGTAGDRVFVNNASFGIYTRFVRQRDAARGPKWLETLPATWHALHRMRAQRFTLRIDGDRRCLRTPLLFVGNNEYALDLGRLGQRESLDDGCLSIRAVAAQDPLGLLAFAARAVFGLARPERDFAEYGNAREIVIEGTGVIEGAFDGELARVALPLRLRSAAAALGVVTPYEDAPGGRESGRGLLASRSRTP
ncbi:MAG TPA: diacylglycerol kinase family protein [Novosphingobium sp.]